MGKFLLFASWVWLGHQVVLIPLVLRGIIKQEWRSESLWISGFIQQTECWQLLTASVEALTNSSFPLHDVLSDQGDFMKCFGVSHASAYTLEEVSSTFTQWSGPCRQSNQFHLTRNKSATLERDSSYNWAMLIKNKTKDFNKPVPVWNWHANLKNSPCNIVFSIGLPLVLSIFLFWNKNYMRIRPFYFCLLSNPVKEL